MGISIGYPGSNCQHPTPPKTEEIAGIAGNNSRPSWDEWWDICWIPHELGGSTPTSMNQHTLDFSDPWGANTIYLPIEDVS